MLILDAGRNAGGRVYITDVGKKGFILGMHGAPVHTLQRTRKACIIILLGGCSLSDIILSDSLVSSWTKFHILYIISL